MRLILSTVLMASIYFLGPVIAGESLQTASGPQGVTAALEVRHLDPDKEPGVFREGDDLVVSFLINDAAGKPMNGLYPAAWMDIRSAGKPTTDRLCADKTRTFLSGSLLSKAEIDLNVFYVVSLNTDGTITIVDPLFGFGGSKLLAMAQLEGPGDDWAMTSDQQLLFVSVPEANRVSVINTSSWEVVGSVDVGPNPRRVVLQADDQYLWAAHDGGVSAISTRSLEVKATFETGPGPHDLVVDENNRFVFSANSGDGTVSVIDARNLKKLKDIPVGKNPVSLTYSAKADLLLAACRDDGVITAIDAKRHVVLEKMPAQKGLRQVAFAPDGRLAMAINPVTDELHIIDGALNRIVQTGRVGKRPGQIAFSDELAYILHGDDDVTLMIPLGEIGVEGKPIPLADFPSARFPIADPANHSLTTALVKAPAEHAVIFPNTEEGSIYYYREGMAAPMGQFNNYGHTPRSLMVLDRSLQELKTPGRYQTTAHVKKPGVYDVVFFLENPRISHCFELQIQIDPTKQAERRNNEVHLRYVNKPTIIPSGQDTTLQFVIADWQGKPKTDIQDVTVLLMAPGGAWHRRVNAVSSGDGYTAVLKPPRPGYYYVHVKSLSVGLSSTASNYLVVHAKDGADLSSDPKPEKAGGAPQ